jgi:hypothetical protein
MKTPLMFALTVLVALMVAGCKDAEEAAGGAVAAELAGVFVPEAGKFGVESFEIVYALEGQENGTRTIWVENGGERVGIESVVTVYGNQQHQLYYWDGARGYMKELPDGKVSSMGLRMKVSEPTSFATTEASGLERAGYERVGDRDVLGHPCEHWKHEGLNYEGARWRGIEMEFHNGAGTGKIVQSTVATSFAEGASIPDRIVALADGE